MPKIRFPKDKNWKGFVFKADVVYDVDDRLRYKFVKLQGLAADVPDDEKAIVCVTADGGVEVTPPPMRPPPPPEPQPSIPRQVGGASVVHKGGPWFNVVVDEKIINESPLKREDAQTMADKHNAVAESTSPDSQ